SCRPTQSRVSGSLSRSEGCSAVSAGSSDRVTSAGTGRATRTGSRARNIPQAARIVMCCDAFSAMTTDRPYRRALPLTQAVEELHANAGTQFDAAVVDALLAVLERGSLTRAA